MIKFDNKVSMAATSFNASIAAHACTPSLPPPKASNAVPHAFFNTSSVFSASASESQVSMMARAAPGLPARARRTTLLTAGSPVAVNVCTWIGFTVIPWRATFIVFFGALPSRPAASQAIHSEDSCVNSRVSSTPGLSRRLFFAPANKSWRTCNPEPIFMIRAPSHFEAAQFLK